MHHRLSLVFVIGLVTVAPARAELAAAPPRYEVAVGFAPFFRAYEGAEASQAPSAWITLPVGRLGVQIDHLRTCAANRSTTSATVTRTTRAGR